MKLVAIAGPVGFVGLMIPHICRLWLGSDHRVLIIAAILMGAIFLPWCDTLARVIVAPAELPVGIITALLGGPFFLWMLIRQKR
ncbi:iron chelate uptake ABC transporter family permease subunit [bacterium]|nr:iron chelate uptake ABC transporter family permease subunit [bacterium]